MKLKRAILLGILAYAISFLLGIINALVLAVDLTATIEIPLTMWILAIAESMVVMLFITLWYFRKVRPSAREGFLFGLVAVGAGFVIDALLIIPYIFVANASQDLLAYYTNPLLWLTLIILLGVTTGVGWLKTTQPRKNLAQPIIKRTQLTSSLKLGKTPPQKVSKPASKSPRANKGKQLRSRKKSTQ